MTVQQQADALIKKYMPYCQVDIDSLYGDDGKPKGRNNPYLIMTKTRFVNSRWITVSNKSTGAIQCAILEVEGRIHELKLSDRFVYGWEAIGIYEDRLQKLTALLTELKSRL